jgi:hypothetical protein
MSVLCTSFNHLLEQPLGSRWHWREAEPYSVARWQPNGFTLKELPFLAATGAKGEKLLLRNFSDPVQGYAEALRAGYSERWTAIKQWLDSLEPEKDITLCCWCPHSSQTRRQLERFGTFCCHTGLIGKMIARHRPDITLYMDKDRITSLHMDWLPLNSKNPYKHSSNKER